MTEEGGRESLSATPQGSLRTHTHLPLPRPLPLPLPPPPYPYPYTHTYTHTITHRGRAREEASNRWVPSRALERPSSMEAVTRPKRMANDKQPVRKMALATTASLGFSSSTWHTCSYQGLGLGSGASLRQPGMDMGHVMG